MADKAELKKLDDIRQAELEAFEAEWDEVPNDLTGQQRVFGSMVRAAIKANWFANGFDADDLAQMRGKAVRELGAEVNDLYREAADISPNS